MKFSLIRELESGERVFVSAHDSRADAERRAQALRRFWPGVYVIREAPIPVQSGKAAPERNARYSDS